MVRKRRCVLLVEPDAWRCTGIAKYLSERGVDVISQQSVESILIGAAKVEPDAVMLAYKVIESFGSAAVQRIESTYPEVPVLVHGESDCVSVMASVLAMGADGYFPLAAPQPQLLVALDIICSRRIFAPREAVALMSRPAGDDVRIPQDVDEDLIVLKLLFEGLSNKEIAKRLGIAEVTVKARLTRLYRRFGVKTRLQLLSSAIRQNVIGAA